MTRVSDQTKQCGMGEPNSDDRLWGASRVELYTCNTCNQITRFPRYNNPGKLTSPCFRSSYDSVCAISNFTGYVILDLQIASGFMHKLVHKLLAVVSILLIQTVNMWFFFVVFRTSYWPVWFLTCDLTWNYSYTGVVCSLTVMLLYFS